MVGQNLLVLVPGAACFLAFSWGTLRHFRSVGPMPLGMRLIGAVSLVTMTAFAWSVLAMPLSRIWPAAPVLSIGSLALFVWTVHTTRGAGLALAFAGGQPSGLMVSGPFCYVRHPFYTSYLIFWLATCVATNSGVCWTGLLTLLVCYVTAARAEERLISRGRFAAEYAGYVAGTGMFLPRPKATAAAGVRSEGLNHHMENERNSFGTADVAERIRIGKLDILTRLTQVMALTGLNTLLFLYWVFYHSDPAISWVVPLSTLPIVYGLVLYLGVCWHRRRDPDARADASARFVRYYTGLVLVLGTLWAALLVGLNAVADGDQRSILYATTIGVISTAAVFLPVSVAVAFWTPATLGGLVILAQNGRFIDLQFSGLLLGYSPLILFTTLFINRTLVRRLTHEAMLQDQADVIGLLLRDFEESSSHWLWEIDGDLKLKNVSPRFAAIAQTPAHVLSNRSIFDLLHVHTVLAGAAISGPVIQHIEARSAFANLVVPVEVAGQPRWWSLTGRPVFDRRKRFTGFRGVGADVTEATQDARRTAYLASYDSLTELANRAVFQKMLAEACASAAESPYTVLYLDLDGFKQINDTLGHAVGDALLFAVAQRIRGCVREGGVAARLGGDEFAILMAGATEQAATLLAQRVLDGVRHPVYLDGHKVQVGVSIGIAFSVAGQSAAALLGNADTALYQAKTGGRGTYRLFSHTPMNLESEGPSLRKRT